MDKKSNPSELTTTLHLGREIEKEAERAAHPSAHIENILADSREEDAQVLRKIINGDGTVAMIYIHRGPSQGSRFLITSAGAKIGRATTNEIFLDDVTVSRTHASISFSEGSSHFEIADSSSLNGTYVNGKSIEKISLSNGDEVQIGKFHLLFVTGQK